MLEVHYNAMNKYNQETFKDDERKQADTLGWLMMAIGVNEITEKTIDEMIFRTRFLDFVWGKSYFVSNPSDADLRQLFKNHIGLKIVITNRGLKDKRTRHKFMVNQLHNIERSILEKINNLASLRQAPKLGGLMTGGPTQHTHKSIEVPSPFRNLNFSH